MPTVRIHNANTDATIDVEVGLQGLSDTYLASGWVEVDADSDDTEPAPAEPVKFDSAFEPDDDTDLGD